MKNSLVPLIIALVFLISPSLYANSKVTYKKGDVTVKISEQWQKVTAGMELPIGAQIKTGAESMAEVMLAGGHMIRIRAMTTLDIPVDEENKQEKVGFVNMLIGKIWCKAKPGVGDFAVKTPSAVAGVRGTIFTVFVNSNGDTDVSVFEGLVGVLPSSAPPGTAQTLLNMAERMRLHRSGRQGPRQRFNPEEEGDDWANDIGSDSGDTTSPELTITNPSPGQRIVGSKISISGNVNEESDIIISLDGQVAATLASVNGDFKADIKADSGDRRLNIIAKDRAGNESAPIERSVFVEGDDDTVAPLLQLQNPVANGLKFDKEPIRVTGRATDDRGAVSVFFILDGIDMAPFAPNSDGSFTKDLINFLPGRHDLEVIAEDEAGNRAAAQVYFEFVPPAIGAEGEVGDEEAPTGATQYGDGGDIPGEGSGPGTGEGSGLPDSTGGAEGLSDGTGSGDGLGADETAGSPGGSGPGEGEGEGTGPGGTAPGGSGPGEGSGLPAPTGGASGPPPSGTGSGDVLGPAGLPGPDSNTGLILPPELDPTRQIELPEGLSGPTGNIDVPPVLVPTGPISGIYVNQKTVKLEFTLTQRSTVRIELNGSQIFEGLLNAGSNSRDITARKGINTVVFNAKNEAGTAMNPINHEFFGDDRPPRVTLIQPGQSVSIDFPNPPLRVEWAGNSFKTFLMVRGLVLDEENSAVSSVRIGYNNSRFFTPPLSAGTFQQEIEVQFGTNILSVTAKDSWDNESAPTISTVNINMPPPPTLTLISPAGELYEVKSTSSSQNVSVRGIVDSKVPFTAKLKLNNGNFKNINVQHNPSGIVNFSDAVQSKGHGNNTVFVEIKDIFDREVSASGTFIMKYLPPALPVNTRPGAN